jgi:uroporphyrin-III C-methyltransferase
VSLVGAGPGDPELLTLRGQRCLAEADVVLHDRLIDTRILQHAPPAARLVDVGKRRGQSHTQEWIQRLMIAEARKGLRVVRLKGGDPFMFGRGGEEVEALSAAGIPYEVVPGVSSAVAVPALAGIPVVHRDYASAVAIVSGHRCHDADIRMWATWIKQAGTLVVLMGMAKLGAIVDGLQQAGVSPVLPVAVTRSGLECGDRTVRGTLADIAARACDVGAPAVIVIGSVVAWKQYNEALPNLGEEMGLSAALACVDAGSVYGCVNTS